MLVILLLTAVTLSTNGHFCDAFLQSNSDVAQYIPQEHSELTDWIQDKPFSQVEDKRSPPSTLSIVNPMDVLRQKLLLDMTRRRMRQAKGQAAVNREFLKTIGKRSDVVYD